MNEVKLNYSCEQCNSFAHFLNSKDITHQEQLQQLMEAFKNHCNQNSHPINTTIRDRLVQLSHSNERVNEVVEEVLFPKKGILRKQLNAIDTLNDEQKDEIADFLGGEKRKRPELTEVFSQIEEEMGLDPTVKEALYNSLVPLCEISEERVAKRTLPSFTMEEQKLSGECSSDISISFESLSFENRGEYPELCALSEVLKERLNFLIHMSPHSAAEASLYACDIQLAKDPHSGMPCCALSVNNIVMGYSIFALLKTYGIVNQGQEVYDYQHYGTPSSQTFFLTLEQLRTLSEFFKKVSPLIEQSIRVLQTILEGEKCIEIGKKRISEFLLDRVGLATSSLNEMTRMVEQCQKENKDAPNSLLFAMVGINLEQHPLRDFYKLKFLSWFNDWNMIGANGKPKEFQRHSPYRANINFEQMNKLLRSMVDFIDIQKTVFEISGYSSNFPKALEHFTRLINDGKMVNFSEQEVNLLKDIYIARLTEMLSKAKISYHPSDLASFCYVNTPQGVKENYEKIYMKLVNDFLGVFCLSKQECRLEPDEKMIKQTYGVARATIANQLGQELPNVLLLLSQIQVSFHNYTPHLDVLKERVQNLLNGYPQDPCDPQIVRFDAVIASLQKWAVCLLQRQHFQLSDEMITSSLSALSSPWEEGDLLVAIEKKVQVLLIPLNKWGFEAELDKFKRECFEKTARHVLLSDGEKEELRDFLHIGSGRYTTVQWTSSQERFTSTYMNHYLPQEICIKASAFFRDLFWSLNQPGQDEKLCQLLEYLGFESHVGSKEEKRAAILVKYRGGRENGFDMWQYALFERDLPLYLVSFLLRENVFFPMEKRGKRMLRITLGEATIRQVGGASNYEHSDLSMTTNRAASSDTNTAAQNCQPGGG